MQHATINDRERQEDEMIAISSIYNKNECAFTNVNNQQIRCTVNVLPRFMKKLKVKFGSYNASDVTTLIAGDKMFVEHLPPIRLYIQFPDTYPSQKPPKFSISISWLPPWEISFLCQKLDEIWEENKGSEILLLWVDFLQNDIFECLDIHDSLDISFMHTIYLTPNDYTKSHLAFLSDSRAMNNALFSNPTKLLMCFNKEQHKIEFMKNFYTCPICCEQNTGVKFIELEHCKHIYCKSCMQQYISTRINDNVKIIACPILDCKCNIDVNDIKILCPNLFPRYEELMLQVALDTMDDIIYCPRTACQYPVIRDINEALVICSVCNYSFCAYCHKVYHGVVPCEMTSNDAERLINTYESSDRKKKKSLIKKYGRQQIQSIEKYLTTEYLKNNSKNCPKCNSFISKIEGCNKMICTYCQVYFCWLCGQEIMSVNAYEHFSKSESPCFGRLFEGTEDIDYDIINMI